MSQVICRRCLLLIMLSLILGGAAAPGQTSSDPPQVLPGTSPASAPPSRIAVIDGRILERQLRRVKEIDQQVAEHFRARRLALEEVAERMKNLAAQIQDTSLPLERRKEKQKEGEALEEIYRDEQQALMREEQQFRESLLAPLRLEVLSFIARYAEERGIEVVIDLARVRRPGRPLFFFAPSIDISQDIISRFNALPDRQGQSR